MDGEKYNRTQNILKVSQQFRKSLKKIPWHCGGRLIKESEELTSPSNISGRSPVRADE
jgi:hypothetical protein